MTVVIIWTSCCNFFWTLLYYS